MLAANAEIIIQKNARANMVTGKQPGLPRITFTDESQVFLGGKEVLARYLGRGHTNGDAVIYFPSEKVLHTGDLFVVGAPFCDTNSGGSIKEWDQTLQKALQYDFDTVIPGHGPVSKRDGPGEVCADHGHRPRPRPPGLLRRRERRRRQVGFLRPRFPAQQSFQVRRAGHVQRTRAVMGS